MMVASYASGRTDGLYRPPAPIPMGPFASLVRMLAEGERNLLSLLPAQAYCLRVTPLGRSRRTILLVNAPDLVTRILVDPDDLFPKNDLMVSALEDLVGDSIFVSSGETWRRQRRMIDPAFSLMRITRAYGPMMAAIDEEEVRLAGHAAHGEPLSLDACMSRLTADIICRTIFSRSLASQTARDVFTAFALFERSVASVDLKRLLIDKAFREVDQPEPVRAACRLIRRHIGDLIDERFSDGGAERDDIARAVRDAVDRDSGDRFTREQLIDQIGVFFLAGHETTASVLTWTFFILAMRPEVTAGLRDEVERIAGRGDITLEHTKRMALTRNVFREALRLYPPITFIPRVALHDTEIEGHRVKRGAMIMIAPWAIHRHQSYWRDADRFDPERFSPEREKDIPPGAYLPFGYGPRICVGAGFATQEAVLILARLIRRFDFEVVDPGAVRPVSRLTTRPAHEIACRVTRRF